MGNQFVYDGVRGTHKWYDGTPHPWEFARVWHLEPSLTDPDTVYDLPPRVEPVLLEEMAIDEPGGAS